MIILVENTYRMNNGQKVVLMGHGYGNIMILSFLNRQPQAWKDKYIALFFSIAAPWKGKALTMKWITGGME